MQGLDSMRYAVLNNNDEVVNVIDAEPGFKPGLGLRLIISNTAGPGDLYANGTFETPESPPPEPTARERYLAATTDTERLAVLAEHLGLTDPS